MKKGLLILIILTVAALVTLILPRPNEALNGESSRESEEIADAETVNTPLVQNEAASRVAEPMQSLDTDFTVQPSRQVSVDETTPKEMTLNTGDARIERELQKAKMAAEYSSSDDGVLSEADFRRYAEDRYIKRRDLNGDGRVDGFELRAITQKTEPSVSDRAEPSVVRER